MAKKLRETLNSAYFEAANRLNSKKRRRRIVAYVESYDDVFFWRTVLSALETDKLFFQVMLPARSEHLERGKKAVLMKLISQGVGQGMIACVDADYDYLIQGASESSREVLNNPYVFHTYAYSIENLQCYAPTLHDVCVAVTLNDDVLFDIEEYLRRFSQIIYPLFVWSIWYYRSPNYHHFTITDFLRIIEIGGFKPSKADELLENLRQKVAGKLRRIKQEHPGTQESYQQVKADLLRLGVKPDNTYLFIQGHHLFDKVVLPMMERICERLIRERENEISRQSAHAVQRRNELSCYTNSIEDITAMLKKNTGYLASDLVARIRQDVKNTLNNEAFNLVLLPESGSEDDQHAEDFETSGEHHK